MRIGDLVQTGDGYYGIVVAEREVMLGNGCQEIMDDEAWSNLRVLPINVYQEGTGAVSNFDALVEGRAPCQQLVHFHGRVARRIDAALRRGSPSDDPREAECERCGRGGGQCIMCPNAGP